MPIFTYAFEGSVRGYAGGTGACLQNGGGNGRSTLAGEREWGSHRHRITAAYPAAAHPFGARLAGAGLEMEP